MNYEFRNNDIQRIYSSEEIKVIDKCNCCTAILPTGDTQYYNYCWRCDVELTLENVSIDYSKEILSVPIRRNKTYIVDMDIVKTIIIDYSSPRYMIILLDGTILNGYYRDDKETRDIEQAIKEESGEYYEEDETEESTENSGRDADSFLKSLEIYIAYQDNNRDIGKTAGALHCCIGKIKRAVREINKFAGLPRDN